MHRLLLISCSHRKTSKAGLVPAIERYDGPPFQRPTEIPREVYDPHLTVLILSAKYGLIDSGRPIRYYDCRLTRPRPPP